MREIVRGLRELNRVTDAIMETAMRPEPLLTIEGAMREVLRVRREHPAILAAVTGAKPPFEPPKRSRIFIVYPERSHRG